MRSITTNLGVAILTFAIGTLAWFVNPLRQTPQLEKGPLLVTVTPSTVSLPAYHGLVLYDVTVRNVSDKTIRGYSLGFSCSCRSWDSNDNPYPDGISFLNPSPERQVLRPGESQVINLELRGPAAEVWPDLVHFEQGGNWGPNRGHKEGYVRE